MRCGYCGTYGHNRRTCSMRSNEQKKSDKEHFTRNRRQSKCSYCAENGHNKKTCKKKIADKQDWIAKNIEFRRRFLSDMKESGYGVGAVLCRKNSNGSQQFILLKHIIWKDVRHDTTYQYNANGERMGGDPRYGDQINTHTPTYFGMADDEERRIRKMYDGNFEVISPASPESIQNSVPEDWYEENGMSLPYLFI